MKVDHTSNKFLPIFLKGMMTILWVNMLAFPQSAFNQTTVFSDDFERASVSPGGSPSMTYTSTIATNDHSSIVTDNGNKVLEIGCGSSSPAKVTSFVTGSLSSFSSPFNNKLSSNSGVITWTFNLRPNNTPNGLFGTAGNYSLGVILCTSNSTASALMSSGDGYMVANITGSNGYGLYRFTNGIGGTLTSILGVTGGGGTTSYQSLRITYDPLTNGWSMFIRSDGSSGFADPSSGVTGQVGSTTVDDTYTSSAMSLFGFAWGHNNSSTKVAFFDNYKCTVASTIIPDIVLSSSSPSAIVASNIQQGSTKQLVYKFNTAITTAAAQISQVNFTSGGTYVAADISKFQLWYKAGSDDFATATQVGSDITTSLGTGSHSFVGLSQSIASGTTGYFYITADVAVGATINNQINVSAITTSNLTFVAGTKSGTAFGGQDQTIVAPNLSIAISSTNPAVSSSNVNSGDVKTPLYRLVLNTTNGPTTLTQLDFYTTGTYQSTDISRFQIWYSTTDNLSVVGAASAIINSALGTGVHSFTGLSIPVTNGNTYLWISADISSSAVVGRTIAVPAVTTGNISIGSGTKSGSCFDAGTQTISYTSNSIDYYRTKASGNWNAISTWQSSPDNTTWYNATSIPTSVANNISIQAGHTVTISAAASADQLEIFPTGQLTVNTGVTFTIVDGTGTDLIVNGYLKNSGSISQGTATIVFNSGSIYEHARDQGTIPSANWDVNSTLYMTGQTSGGTIPSGLSQSFGNVTWNAPSSSSSDVELNGSLNTINGNLTLQSSGTSGSVRFTNGSSAIINIGGNVIVSGGEYAFSSGNGIPTINIAGNFDMSAGTFEATRGSGGPNISINGFFKISAGTFTGSTTSATNYSIVIGGDFIISSGTFNGTTSSGTGTNLNIGGNMIVSSGAFYLTHTIESYLVVGGYINISGGMFGIMNGGNKSSFVECGGDFTIGNAATFRPTNNSATQKAWKVRVGGNLAVTGTISGSYSNSASGNYVSFILGGGSNSTPTINYSPTSSASNFTYNVFVESGKTATWLSSATIAANRVLACGGGNIKLNNGIVITSNGTTAIQGGYLDFNVTSYTNSTGTTNLIGNVASIPVAGTISAGSMEISNISGDMTNVVPGMKTTGTGFTGNTYVVGKSVTSLYLSEAASVSGSGVSFTITSSRGTLITGHTAGITKQGNGATGSVQTTLRIFSTSANYEYNNTSTAQNSGTGLPDTVNDLTINNGANPSSTNGVTLNNTSGTVVNGVLYLKDGIVTSTASLPITVNNTATTAVNRTTSIDETYVNGPIRRYLLSGTTAEYLFPTGKNSGNVSRYKPVTFIPVGNAGGRFDAEYVYSNPPSQGITDFFAGSLMGIDKLEYWQFDRASGSTTGKLRIPYVNPGTNNWRDAAGYAINPCSNCNVAVVKRTTSSGNGNWDFTAANNNFSSSVPEYRWYGDQGDITSQTISSFSPFTFGFSYNVILPVKLVSFTGKLQDNIAVLHWTIADNQDLAGFELQHSRDGRSFSRLVDIVPGTTNSYDYRHVSLAAGSHFYRLLVKEKSGNTFYSNIVLLTIGKPRTQVIGLRENPVYNQLTVQVLSATSQLAYAQVTDGLGRNILNVQYPLQAGQNQWQIHIPTIARGMYFLQVTTTDGEKATMRFVKE